MLTKTAFFRYVVNTSTEADLNGSKFVFYRVVLMKSRSGQKYYLRKKFMASENLVIFFFCNNNTIDFVVNKFKQSTRFKTNSASINAPLEFLTTAEERCAKSFTLSLCKLLLVV